MGSEVGLAVRSAVGAYKTGATGAAGDGDGEILLRPRRPGLLEHLERGEAWMTHRWRRESATYRRVRKPNRGREKRAREREHEGGEEIAGREGREREQEKGERESARAQAGSPGGKKKEKKGGLQAPPITPTRAGTALHYCTLRGVEVHDDTCA